MMYHNHRYSIVRLVRFLLLGIVLFASNLCLLTRATQMTTTNQTTIYDHDYAMNLDPFQIQYYTSANILPNNTNINTNHNGTSSSLMNAMRLLDTTKNHLTTCLQSIDPNVERITLYFHMSIGNNMSTMFQNRTQIAFDGIAYYKQPPILLPPQTQQQSSLSNNNNNRTTTTSVMTMQQMIQMEYLCFLGTNATIYIQQLQQKMSWYTIHSMKLMNLAGNPIVYQNGTMIIMNNNTNNNSSNNRTPPTIQQHTMSDTMSRTILFIAVLVPIGVFVLVLIGYGCYSIWYRIQWYPTTVDIDPNGPVWSTVHPQSQAMRMATLNMVESSMSKQQQLQHQDHQSDHDSIQVIIPNHSLRSRPLYPVLDA